ncbi:MAG TPA: GspE/PulE family protein [Clostridia bacterium]|nr:GspE/PulE family protein [Clostridia bacterium]
MDMNRRKRLGDMLIDAQKISSEQLSDALNLQKSTGKRLGEVLVSEGFIAQKEIIKLLETQLGIPQIDLKKYMIDHKSVKLVPENIARKHELIAVHNDGVFLTVAMSDPLNYFALDDVKMASGMEVKTVIAASEDILAAIERYYGGRAAERAVEDFKREYRFLEKEAEVISDSDINSAPTVRLVNSIIEQAVRIGSSDIHIEPFEKEVRVRFRVDGVLQEMMKMNKQTLPAIVTRVKILSQMNIAEKRIPQDGRIETQVDGKDIDLRVSTLPTIYGEKVVIRILNKSSFLLSKEELGLNPEDIKKFNRIVSNPYGIILVTGPTGSGKSTTLYSILTELNDAKKNIITVEDPVEYTIAGVNQVQVNVKAGLTFANGLRSILRQDPNIIMVGEIRDNETAEIAVRSSLTGHLVLSTLHTNDAPGAITRLVDMSVEPFLVSSSLVGVIAQRLVRKVCSSCKEEYLAEDWEKRILMYNYNMEEKLVLHRGKGCQFCGGSGYKGRTAIFEIMPITKKHRALIDRRATTDELREYSVREEGMITLRQNAIKRVLDGTTSIEELLRVTYEQT